MSTRGKFNVYDKTHNLQIFKRNGVVDFKNININISDYKDTIIIKARDVDDFGFNYTANIDNQQFDFIQREQNLDINFKDLGSNLIDMLGQIQSQDMYLKCETDPERCRMIFYCKSKIKTIVYLTIDLQLANHKEIFDEMNQTIVNLQALNKNVTSQLQITQRLMQEKDCEVLQHSTITKHLEKKFLEDLQTIGCVVSSKMQDCNNKLLSPLLVLQQRILKIIQDVEVVKTETILKSNSSARLLQSMESLRLENVESIRTIDELKRENCCLKNLQLKGEQMVTTLNETINTMENNYKMIKARKDEVEVDVKQATRIIAEKTMANDNLAKDLCQANQTLLKFNNLLESRNNEIKDLQALIESKDQSLQDQTEQLQRVRHDYEAYKQEFNSIHFEKLHQELYDANKRIEEVEKQNRETIKLNELFTRKLASGDFVNNRNFHR